ncbi:MAG: tetratricopeptide repeat protein, partial [Planctomycetota bacterium]
PSYGPARFMEGCSFVELNMPDPAQESFLLALKDDSENAEIYFRLGLCAFRTSRFLDAETFLLAALQKAPQHPEAHLFLAELYWDHLGDRERAELHARRFLAAAPADHPERARVEARLPAPEKK